MKSFSLFVFACLASVSLIGQGIEFFHGTWEEALAKAKTEEKIIFVDAYAAWCGPCKRMAAQVFPQKEVGDFFNSRFVNMKLDYEKPEANTFRQNYSVSAFPTLFFIDFDGKIVHKAVGGQQADGLIKLGEFALSKVDRSGNFEEAYNNGDRSPELVYKYLKALNQAGKPVNKIANDYLATQKDLTSKENLKIIYEGTGDADSKVFDLFVKYLKEIEGIFPAEAIDTRIEIACKRTAAKAIEFQTEALLLDAQGKMKKLLPDRAETFAIQTNMRFYKSAGKPDEYLKACKAYAKMVIPDKAPELMRLSHEMREAFPLDDKVQKEALKIEEKVTKTKPTPTGR